MTSRLLPLRFLVATALALSCLSGALMMSAFQGPPTNPTPRGPRMFDTMEYKIYFVAYGDTSGTVMRIEPAS